MGERRVLNLSVQQSGQHHRLGFAVVASEGQGTATSRV